MKSIVHFIGIKGIGISSLAKWFKARGWKVSGSDIAIKGHKASFLPKDARLVIYSNAISKNNPELLKAKKLGIKTFSYPEALGELTKIYKPIAVAGSHGKSTTTALLSLILIGADLDPTVIIGTKLGQFGGSNFRNGKSGWLVIEADEWKGAFWRYSPLYAIVTNIDKEHLDFYKNFSNVKKSFLKFIKNIGAMRPHSGILVLNKDDKPLYDLRNQINKIARKNNVKVLWYGTILLQYSAYQRVKKVLRIPGRHNVSNALAAYTLAKSLGIKEKTILDAFKKYKGAWRRMEYRGMFHVSGFKSRVYDDYAHHPTEIKATLAAFREKFPKSKIVCVFQPHQADRLKRLFKEFQAAFKDADYLILLPIYKVAGRDHRKDKRFTSKILASKIPGAIYLKNPKKLPQIIKKTFNSQHSHTNSYNSHYILVMMGAGDIVKYTSLLLR